MTKEKKKRPPYNEGAQIRGGLRRAFSRSQPVIEFLKPYRREVPRYKKDGSRAKKDAVQYLCNVCKGYVGSTKISVDHVEPVIHPVRGFVDWNEFIARLFCSVSNLQAICDNCHATKTKMEAFARQLNRDILLLNDIGSFTPPETLKEILRKFTKKRMENYPAEVVERVMQLKASIARKKA